MTRLLSVIAFMIGCFLNSHAQTGNVKGILADDDGETLPGAHLMIDGLNIGTVSDMDGSFFIKNIPEGKQTLTINYLGYNETKIPLMIVAGETVQLNKIIIEESSTQLMDVEVKGDFKHGSESKAINLIKTSNKIISVVSAEGIHKLPDKNAAESLKRISGIAVQNNKGEGAYVSLRGTPHDWTATLVNGDRMPVADEENNSRSFEFEVLPSELIHYIIVTKSVTPDIEGDNIGGAINFLTRQSVDKKTFHVHFGAGFNALAMKPTMDAAFIAGNRTPNGKFSYVINGSYWGRYYAAQAYKIIYGNNFNHGINRFELKNYYGMRNTVGTNAAIEYKPSTNVKLGARFLGGAMLDDKRQQKQMYVYQSGENDGLWLQNIHGKLNRRLLGGDLTGEIKLHDKSKLFLKVASYSNRFEYGNVPFGKGDPRNGYFTQEFRQRRVDIDYLDVVPVKIDGSYYDRDSDEPSLYFGDAKLLDIDHPLGAGDSYRSIQPRFNYYIDPDSMEFRRAFSELNTTWERDPIVGQWDYQSRIKNNLTVQAGTKHRLKEGSRNLSLHRWEIDATKTGTKVYYMSLFETEPVNEHGGYMRELSDAYTGTWYPFLTERQKATLLDELGDTLREIPMNKQNPDFRQWAGAYYDYREIQNHGYAMAEWRATRKLSIVGGVRMEHTSIHETGDTLDRRPEFLMIDTSNGIFTYYFEPQQRATEQKYLAWLPALNFNYQANAKTNYRFALSRSYHRQNFAELKPGQAVINFSDFEYTFGNPELRPAYSWNFDLMYEYFWGNKGMFSVGAFYKYVTDHIFAITISDSADAASGIIFKSYDNAGTSYVCGAELTIYRQFNFLKGFWSGFGVNANITYSFSRMQVPGRFEQQPMSEQTPLLYNVALFYEKYGVYARVALNYTGPYLRELNLAAVKDIGLLHTDTKFDVFQGELYSMDALISYQFKKHYSVYAEAINLLNWKYLEYRGDARRPIRIEYYRQRFQVGFKYEF